MNKQTPFSPPGRIPLAGGYVDVMQLEAEIEKRIRSDANAETDLGGLRGCAVMVTVKGLSGSNTTRVNFVTAAGKAYIALGKIREKHKAADVHARIYWNRIWLIYKFLACCVEFRFEASAQSSFQAFADGLNCLKIDIEQAVKDAEYSQVEDLVQKLKASLLAVRSCLLGAEEAGEQLERAKLDELLAMPELPEELLSQELFGPTPFPVMLPQVPIIKLTVASCSRMLAELRAAYSVPEFHAEYIRLRNSPQALGAGHVEFALTVQGRIIEKYGFDPSLAGVIDMRNHTSTLAHHDAVVAKLLHDIHALLEAKSPLPKPEAWIFEPGWRPEMPPSPRADAAQLVQTAKDTGERLATKPAVPFESDFEFSGPTISVDILRADQELLGFGGAFTEASALVFHDLSAELQDEVLELYFGLDGIGFSLGRIHINSCDFSAGNYDFDNIVDDFQLNHFDGNVTHDTKALIPFVRAAQKKLSASGQSLRLLASPWSPPAWMKTSSKMNGSESPGLRDDCHKAWARYFSKWIAAYKKHSIPIWAVTVQNEPEHDAPWEACRYTPATEADFLGRCLGPELQSSHPEVQVFTFDHNKDHVYAWAKAAYSHPAASSFVTGVAFHWYSGDHFENVRRVHHDFPDAVLLSTEACYERSRWKGKLSLGTGHWSFGEGYAHDIIGNLNAGASGWIDWNLILDESGGPNHVGNVCDAPVRADVTKNELYVHPQFFFLGHFSKYLLPGSKRLHTSVTQAPKYEGATRPYGTCSAEDGLQATSFLRPDGTIASIVLNSADLSVSFKLQAGTNRVLRACIPARAVQTYIFQMR
eukprot:TRINITY_DN7673_c0_g1_i3.p1 TRINITY_DN7673_c0_g1~~TRINITY_DN7673_c0_g1_i3.p1  ORF type:complete len:815 (-),score=114.55 TRINITY_DN7673_c0_g1_i3:45-2489(-)